MSQTTQRRAVAWWIERDGGEVFVCFDTERAETVAFDVTDASFGGEIETQKED